MNSSRTKYDKNLKKNAGSLSYTSPQTITDVAANLGISACLLYRWWK